MSEINYLSLKPPADHEELVTRVRLMREIRLLSLQTNPESFFTRYEDEFNQPMDFFQKRVEDPRAKHFVATTGEPVRYIAFLVLVKDQTDETDTASFREQSGNSSSENENYYMAATYVESAYRGKGVFTRLFRLGIDFVRKEAERASKKTVIISTAAMECNVGAQNLYLRLGFEVTSHEVLKNKIDVDVPVVNMRYRLEL